MSRRGQQIQYALVSRGTVVLAENTLEDSDGIVSPIDAERERIINSLLQKLPSSDQSLFYAHHNTHFHILTNQGITFLCMCSSSLGKYIPLKFLQNVRVSFRAQFGERAALARAYAFDADFKGTLQVLMSDVSSYSGGAGDQILVSVEAELQEAKQVMESNIEKVIDRGEKLSELVEKTDNLQTHSVLFASRSKALERHFWCKYLRWKMLIVFAILVVLIVIVVFSCGGLSFDKCRHR